ncbi:hypothetical protein KFK14_11490 [Sphingobium phenoxybenzoativorans]|uniref:Uncharacterized protein n=1 Tax=Sphingobium phenoxybenzoativorans TaxID=1592790 RepID=A0A975KBF1_9SPHN|nr:hypothetical protein [Sphingobium phenoxybenzoativorans]QUT07952.1 hypothetical protein KFK14_11490 [Sphingobium phenoxybenzoativorans]
MLFEGTKPARHEAMRTAFELGDSIDTIADEFGVTTQAVRNVLRRAKLIEKATPEEISEARRSAWLYKKEAWLSKPRVHRYTCSRCGANSDHGCPCPGADRPLTSRAYA